MIDGDDEDDIIMMVPLNFQGNKCSTIFHITNLMLHADLNVLITNNLQKYN